METKRKRNVFQVVHFFLNLKRLPVKMPIRKKNVVIEFHYIPPLEETNCNDKCPILTNLSLNILQVMKHELQLTLNAEVCQGSLYRASGGFVVSIIHFEIIKYNETLTNLYGLEAETCLYELAGKPLHHAHQEEKKKCCYPQWKSAYTKNNRIFLFFLTPF